MDGDRGEMVSSRVTGVSLNVLSPVTGQREPNEAVAWDRNLAVWYSTLWQLSWVPPYNQMGDQMSCHWCPSKEGISGSTPRICTMGLLRWMRKRPWPRERVSHSECEPQQVCVPGVEAVHSRNVCKVVLLSPNHLLGPEIGFQSQKHCWGYKLSACFISLLSGCLGYKLPLFLH